MKVARRVRRAAWGNGPRAIPAPRPRPTQPAGAVVISVDEKSQIQALDRTQPILPLRQGIPEQQTHDYIRHGTTSLFAALEVATGKITADACYPRHTNVEFLAFLKLIAKTHPRVQLCVICDNYATHVCPESDVMRM